MKRLITHGLSFIFILTLIMSCSPESENLNDANFETKKGKKQNVPDYSPSVSTSNSAVLEFGNVDFNVFFAEYNGVSNNPNDPIYLLIKKSPGLVISYDENLTTLNNQSVGNDEWSQVYESNFYYYYQYRANNGVFPGGTAMNIGFNATLTCQGNGDVAITAELKPYSGGQTNISNDVDSDFISCF